MSLSHFLCWSSSGPLCPKPYFSRSFAEIVGNAPQQGASQCWGLGWKLGATVAASIPHLYSFFKSQLLIFHFQGGSATAVNCFLLLFTFFHEICNQKGQIPIWDTWQWMYRATPAAGSSPMLVWHLYLVRAEGNTMLNSFRSLHITGHKALLSDSYTEVQITFGWTRAYLWGRSAQSRCNLFLIILYFLCISTMHGILHRNNCS